MTDDRIPFLKFKQYAVTVEYNMITPKELAEKLRQTYQEYVDYVGPTTKIVDSRYVPDIMGPLFSFVCMNKDTILAALEAYEPKSNPITAWAIKSPKGNFYRIDLTDATPFDAWSSWFSWDEPPTESDIEARNKLGYRAVKVEIREVEE
jgi:hypothetical protein